MAYDCEFTLSATFGFVMSMCHDLTTTNNPLSVMLLNPSATGRSCHAVECHLTHSLPDVQDPADGSPAVLMMKNNITQQKSLEQDLEISQAALQK